MPTEMRANVESNMDIIQATMELESRFLGRSVQVDFYLAKAQRGEDRIVGAGTLAGCTMSETDEVLPPGTSLLLINDGQELGRLGLAGILDELQETGNLGPLLCAGIYAGPERKQEYGTAYRPDYQGWGARAGDYDRFIMEELIPAIRRKYAVEAFKEKAFAGFSLGALSAMDIVWRHPEEFARAGLFSGSFWWRTMDKEDPSFDEHRDRIMHDEVRKGGYYPWLKFFFECGTEDEREDRNRNGVIDSIDDAQDLIGELVRKGYDANKDIRYLQIEGGRHEVGTWAKAMPEFLLWGWGTDGNGGVDGNE
jgi:esterase/lipase superfamily enzyme